jgi:hypothetical protein
MRARIETLIGAIAPLLDVVLFVGDRASRVAGRNDIDPEQPRRLSSAAEQREPERLHS